MGTGRRPSHVEEYGRTTQNLPVNYVIRFHDRSSFSKSLARISPELRVDYMNNYLKLRVDLDNSESAQAKIDKYLNHDVNVDTTRSDNVWAAKDNKNIYFSGALPGFFSADAKVFFCAPIGTGTSNE